MNEALQSKYGSDLAKEIIKSLEEKLREDSDIDRALVMKILLSPIRKSGATAIKDRFIMKLDGAGASVVRAERQLYIINNTPVWLTANGITLKTRFYWNAISEKDYERYVRKSHIIILCGCEETAVIIPPEVHNEWFVPERLRDDSKNMNKWYSYTIVPKEDHLGFYMRIKRASINVNLNQHINDYSLLGIKIKDLPSREAIISAQHTATRVLESVAKGMVPPPKTEQKRRGRPTKKRETLNDEIILSEAKKAISDIDSFLNGSTEITPDELFLWIWLCYRFELYERGAKLFRRINREEFPDDLYRRIEIIGHTCERMIE